MNAGAHEHRSRIGRLVGVALLAVAVLVVFSGCTRGGKPSATNAPIATGPAETTSTEASQPAPPAPTPFTPSAALASLSISLDQVAGGLLAPLYVTGAGDGSGRLFVVEQPGRIRVIKRGKLLASPFLDIRSRVSYGGEQGLLGLAFAHDYPTSGRFYVDYTDVQGNTVVARFTASPPSADRPVISGPTTVLHIQQPYANHNGGCIQFGPDGMLWIGMGDGGSEGDPGNRGQRMDTPLGKMLRIDVSGGKYAVPKDNPYASEGYPRNIIWARGLRNPWRFSFDFESGDLWIGDVGQNAWEEIDLVPARSSGLNFGWRKWEGTHPYPPGSPAGSRAGFTFPIVEYPHPTGEAVTGGYVYRGQAYPAMVGTYFYADYVKGWIAGIRTTTPDGTALKEPDTRILRDTALNLSSFGVDDAGELYVTDLGGGVYRVAGRAK